MRRAGIARCFIVVSLFTCLSARADDAGADDEAPKTDNRARAQQLFDAALAAAEAGDFAAACPKFLASQEADPKTSTLLNLASCYEKNGQTASAWGAFREAEGLARKIGRADWETSARDRAAVLEPKLVKLTIVVPEPSRTAGLVVTRDNAKVPAGEWSVGIPVDPGEHVVGATADGRKPWNTTIALRDASTSVTVPALEMLPVEAPLITPPPKETPPPPKEGWSTWKTTGAIAAGVGTVSFIVAGALAITAKGDYDSARVRCNGTRGCSPDVVADSESAYDLAGAATVAFVSGAVLLTGGALLFFLAPQKSVASASQNAASIQRVFSW